MSRKIKMSRKIRMKKTALSIALMLPATLLSAAEWPVGNAIMATEMPVRAEQITAAQISLVQNDNTYTYVRCWYRPHYNHDDSATQWEWAKNPDGSYYTVPGYWYSSVSLMNMFFTDTPQQTIKDRCEETIGVEHDTRDLTFFASDMRYSYNHTFWTNDKPNQPEKINKVISLGDSISDTGNFFNASQWTFPNSNTWFLGHFSNGFVWTEYLAEKMGLPMYNWAVGGAAGDTQYLLLSGIHDQVESYLTYMKMAKNYRPENSLFTMEFGLNDFVNYNRSVEDVSRDFTKAMDRLTSNGAQHIVILSLPDASKAPQFKYADPAEAQKVKQKIEAYNTFLKAEVMKYQMAGVNVALFDTHRLFEDLTANPQQFGFRNATDSCLDINRNSAKDYLMSHSLRNDCATYGSDSYVFWGVTHPTTSTHRLIAEKVADAVLDRFHY